MRYPIRSHSARGREGGCCLHNRVIPIVQTRTHTGIYDHTLSNWETSTAAFVQAMLLVGCVWRQTDCIWVRECVCLSVRKGGMYDKRRLHWLCNKVPVAIADTHTRTRFWLCLVSHMADNITLGYCEDAGAIWFKRGREGEKPCMCKSPPPEIRGFSDTMILYIVLKLSWRLP